MNDSSLIFICLTQTGNIYHQMKHPKALGYLQEALQMVRGRKINQTIDLLSSIGAVYIEQGKFSEAEKSLNEAYEMAQKIELKYACGKILKTMGILYYNQNQYARASDCASRALQVGNEMQYQELKKECYQLLSNTYAATGNYKEAYHYHTYFKQLNESFPTLTLNERKLCVFLKLNMTNKDIAQITFQSEEALKKARMRLRKKLELDRDENLAGFIQGL